MHRATLRYLRYRISNEFSRLIPRMRPLTLLPRRARLGLIVEATTIVDGDDGIDKVTWLTEERAPS